MIRRRVGTACAAVLSVALVATMATAVGPMLTSGARATAPAVRGVQVQIIPPPPPPAAATARYRVTVNINWTGATHPGTLPGNAHVSNPVYAVHSAPGAMFAVGGQASPGIEAMAELGATSTLLAELRSNPNVSRAAITGGVAAPAAATRSFDVDVDQSRHRISLVTMLAPSPDWFVGFADRPTLVDGQWINSATFPLGNYDAGTDSGPGFTSGDSDTQPQQPISGPRDGSFVAAAAQNPFGTVTITKIG